jgi:hypothetical protein
MTKTLAVAGLILGFVFAGIGCAGPEQAQPASSGAQTKPGPEKVELAAEIAREIQKAPGDADAILEKHGTTREEFEELLYEIAADPELSRAYREAVE